MVCRCRAARPVPHQLWNRACITIALPFDQLSVQIESPSQRQRGRIVRASVAGLMLLLWLGIVALAVAPRLHLLLHDDAKAPQHNCLITQLNERPVLAGCVVVLAPSPPSVFVWLTCASDFQFLPTLDYGLSPGRGPPSVSSSIMAVG